jgi:hypothetical protein
MQAAYMINGVPETNAISAWETILTYRQNNTLKDFYLYLNNEIYDNVNWNLAPTKSISELEQEHAVRLRQTYDYVRIWYSGGSDSHSIVESFLRAGQRIDEIAVVFWKTIIPFSVSGNTGGDDGQEIVLGWLTELYQKYNADLPKVNIVRINKSHLDAYFTKNYFYRKIGYGGNFSYNLNSFPEISKITDRPPTANYCEVLGMEKPRMTIDSHGVWFQMNDRQIMHNASDTVPVEWFYLSSLTPELIKAQLWSVIHWSQVTQGSKAGAYIQQLQSNKHLYNTWCQLLGRSSSPKQNSLALLAKNTKNSLDPVSKTIYGHLDDAINDQGLSWQHYCEFANYETVLAQQWDKSNTCLPGILTKKYFLTDLQ